jgi:hypothetical protein
MADANLVHAVALPPGAEPPIAVFVNGAQRAERADYVVDDGVLRFDPPLRAQPRLGLGRKTMLAMGIGVYGDLKGDTLDVQYQREGRTQMASIPLTPEAAGEPRRA